MNIYGHGDTIPKLFTLASSEVQTCMFNFLLQILTWLSIRYLKSNISKRKKILIVTIHTPISSSTLFSVLVNSTINCLLRPKTGVMLDSFLSLTLYQSISNLPSYQLHCYPPRESQLDLLPRSGSPTLSLGLVDWYLSGAC